MNAIIISFSHHLFRTNDDISKALDNFGHIWPCVKAPCCAWTPNNVFMQFLLVPVEITRFSLQSWWARLATGASCEAPVDNECLGSEASRRRRGILVTG